MLTDYHTHLRPDDVDATAERYFTERNVERYLEAASERGIAELGFSEHVHRFRQALDIWRHPFWEENAVDDLDAYVDFVLQVREAGHPVKLGIEMDFIPGREEQIATLLEGRPWDYVIGSVHFIADRAVDHEGYDAWRATEPDQVWSAYFSALGDAAASGLFDVLAHPDLVKIWGDRRAAPARPPRAFYELALEGISASDVSIEVSTAGLRKPVGEMYPAPELLAMLVAEGKSVTLSSDAHQPDQLGFGYEQALDLLAVAGVERICVWRRRERSEEPVG